MGNYEKISDNKRIVLVYLGWGYQLIDRQENRVIAAILDNESSAKYAADLFEFYKDKPEPFRRRQLAFHEGKRVRILGCIPNHFNGSGWIVDATLVTRGRIGRNPRIDFRKVDSGLFSVRG